MHIMNSVHIGLDEYYKMYVASFLRRRNNYNNNQFDHKQAKNKYIFCSLC